MYRLHKASGQAVVTLDGRDFYLGEYKAAAKGSSVNALLNVINSSELRPSY